MGALQHYAVFETLAVLAACIVIPLYVIAPFKIRKNQTRQRRPRYEAVDIAQFPEEIANVFRVGAKQLSADGFQVVGFLEHHVPASKQIAHLAVWAHPADRASAQVIAIRTPSHLSGDMKATILTTYRTDFTDGTYLVTSNTRTAGIFPTDPKADGITCPGISDLNLLYRVHRARVDQLGKRVTATLDRVRNASECLLSEHEATFARLVRANYYTLDAATDQYRMTVKGGFICCYRTLWPLRPMRLAARQRKANRVLRELGFGDLDKLALQQQRQPMSLLPDFADVVIADTGSPAKHRDLRM